ncbi:hypothetical protein ACH9D2_18350 [Kocuria sp. M4R2S49]|uniref:hypothetical protein n=1 Tax=Kocuria rhizosphaericola TaxID=3376284 RepID=UPI0037A8F495
MRRTTRAVTAAAFAAGIGLVAAAPAQAAMEIYDISDATRIAEGAALEGTYTVTCTAGTDVFVSLTVTQRVSDGRIANGSYFEQWTCEGGEVTLDYQTVAYNMAFDEGPAVVSGFIQECQPLTQPCGPGTNLPLVVIQVAD